MIKLAIPYFSRSGHTEKLARIIADGAQTTQNIKTSLINIQSINDSDWHTLHTSDGIIFGSPTYLGNIAAGYKAFIEETSPFWRSQKWANKIAGGFTIGNSPSGDKLNTLMSLAIFAMEQGMIWVGQNQVGSLHNQDNKGINLDGSWVGLMATSHRDKKILIREGDIRTARIFGKRVAQATTQWLGR